MKALVTCKTKSNKYAIYTIRWASVKPGLWTMNWSVDYELVHGLDHGLFPCKIALACTPWIYSQTSLLQAKHCSM